MGCIFSKNYYSFYKKCKTGRCVRMLSKEEGSYCFYCQYVNAIKKDYEKERTK